MKVYALREIETKRYLSIKTYSNEGEEYCNECTVKLKADTSLTPWSTTNLTLVQYVRDISTPWYNSCVETPNHGYKPEELEIVELGSEEVIACEDLPTDYVVINKIGGYIPPHKIEKSKHTRTYSWYDYQRYLK